MVPLPTMPQFVTNKQQELQRVFDSIPDAEWAMLEEAFPQLPPQPACRTYRVTRPEFTPRLRFSSAAQLESLVRKYLPEDTCTYGAAITREALANASQAAKRPLDRAKVVALHEHHKCGVVVLVDELVLFFREAKHEPVSLRWDEIKISYWAFDYFEIVKRDNQRIVTSSVGFQQAMVQLEKFINAAVGVGPND